MSYKLKIGTVGCGVVGAGLLKLLDEKRDVLAQKYGFEFDVVFVTDWTRGTLIDPSGLDLKQITDALDRDRSLKSIAGVKDGQMPLDDVITAAGHVDFVCEMTPTNYETGEPSLSILRTAMRRGAHAVTCSKGGASKDMAGLKALADENGVMFRFECSVLSGTPLLNMARGPLASCEITRAMGIVNGTTNFILTEMEHGREYAEALAEAQRLGYAERDPSGDVEGWDSSVKLCIMAGELLGSPISIDRVDRTGITGVTLDDVKRAAGDGKRIKLIACAERTADGGVKASVRPTEIDATHPLAAVSGVTNAVVLSTDDLGDVTIIGPGAGSRQTAHGLVADMIEIASAAGRLRKR